MNEDRFLDEFHEYFEDPESFALVLNFLSVRGWEVEYYDNISVVHHRKQNLMSPDPWLAVQHELDKTMEIAYEP